MAGWGKSWISACALLGCLVVVVGGSELGCLSTYDPATNYFSYLTGNVTGQAFVLPINLTIVDTANDFAVSYGPSWKIARNSRRGVNYLLSQCGAPAPNKLQLGLNSSSLQFQIPAGNYSIDTDIPVGFLELLGGLNALAGIDSSTQISSPCLQQYVTQGLVQSINASDPSVTDQYTALFTSPYVGAPVDNRTNLVLFDATLDPGPLKRAEWIKFIATFLNLEERGYLVYETIRQTYQCLNGSMSNSSTKPTVAWLSYYSDEWTVEIPSYKLQLVSDAGGVNLKVNASQTTYNMTEPADVLAFHNILKTVNVILDDSYAPSPPDYKFANFCSNANISINDPSYPFLVNQSVWRNDKRLGDSLGLDWFEGAVAQPQIVLHDLLGIFYPSLKYGVPYYFRNIAKDEAVVTTSSEGCTRKSNEALDPTVFACPLTAKQNGALSAAAAPSLLGLLLASTLLLGITVG